MALQGQKNSVSHEQVRKRESAAEVQNAHYHLLYDYVFDRPHRLWGFSTPATRRLVAPRPRARAEEGAVLQ